MNTNASLAQLAVDALNEAFRRDPAAMHALIATRFPCNQLLADDPHIVVDLIPVIEGQHFCVGTGGVLAGIMAAMGLPKIATKWSDKQGADGRRQMIGFAIYEETVN